MRGDGLHLRRRRLDDPKRRSRGLERLEAVVKDYPETEAAREAKKLLDEARAAK